MDFSFPCVGNLDDGIFHDLGLDDETPDRVRAANSSPGDIPDPLQLIILSPDALDLALMAFDAEEEIAGADAKDDDDDVRGGEDSSPRGAYGSPLCDAAIARYTNSGKSRSQLSNRRTSGQAKNQGTRNVSQRTTDAAESIKSISVQAQKGQVSFDCGGGKSRSHGDESSPRGIPVRWPPAKESRSALGAQCPRGISNAFPPRLPNDDLNAGPRVGLSNMSQPSGGVTHGSFEAKASARVADRQPLVDSTRAQQWARQQAAAFDNDAIASSVRKEEEALAEGRGIVEGENMATSDVFAAHRRAERSAPGGSECAVVGRKVSFAGECAGRGAEDSVDNDDDDRHLINPNCTLERAAGGGGREGGKYGQMGDDLLARASELHSSVAGQLRSVNELLKRKSYIYIDTSWSAKQLPCTPTAWKGRAVDGGSGGGRGSTAGARGRDEGSIRAESSSAARLRHRPATSSPDARNVMVRLDGRWVSAGSKNLNVGVYSIPGEKAHEPFWKNQDAGLAIAPLDRREGQALFAIFDGHGTNGRQASHACMERLPKYVVSTSRSADPASALRRSCQRLHRDLATGVAGDCTRSGTTLCAAVLTGRRLTVANVGDSGCLRISRRAQSPGGAASLRGRLGSLASGDAAAAANTGRRTTAAADGVFTGGVDTSAAGRQHGLVSERLSRDHKPENKGELERIKAAGGLVFPLPKRDLIAGSGGDGGHGEAAVGTGRATETRKQGMTAARDFGEAIPRVWTAGGDGPGLAMSRSIGDKMAHSVGVTYEPEITEFDLDPRRDVMLVFASDGVWDVLRSEDIRRVAETHVANDAWCPQALSAAICRRSLSEWATKTSGGSDDITCLVVKIAGAVPPVVVTQRFSPSAEVAAPTQVTE